MKRRSDPVQVLQKANPVPEPDLLPYAPDSLVEEIINMSTPSPERHRRLRRRVVLPAVALIALTATAAAWALTRQPEQTTEIACNGEVIIPARSGDPVADCAAELARVGITHGELKAYTNQFGGVAIYDSDQGVPTGAQLLEDGFRQDTASIEFKASLNDVVTGLESSCYSTDAARPIVEREMAAVDLDWDITIGTDNGEPRIADGATTCAYAIVQPEDEAVMLISLDSSAIVGGSGNEPPWTAFSERLVQQLEAECLTLPAAMQLAEDVFQEAVEADERNVAQVMGTVDNDATCSRVDITVGGSIFVDVRGPEGQ